MEVGVERRGDLVGEERTERPPGDSAHNLTDQMSLGEGVVSRRRTRLPPRGLRGEHRSALVPVVKIVLHDRLLPTADPRRVRHEMSYEHLVFAVLCELGPVATHRCVHVELAPVHQQQCGKRCHGLRGGPHVDDGVALPRPSSGCIRPTAPEVGDDLALHGDGHRRAEITPVVERARKHIDQLLERCVAETVYLGHGDPLIDWRTES